MVRRGAGYQAFGIGIGRVRGSEGQHRLQHADLERSRRSTFLADLAGFGVVMGGLALILLLAAVVLHAGHHLHTHGLHGARFYR